MREGKYNINILLDTLLVSTVSHSQFGSSTRRTAGNSWSLYNSTWSGKIKTPSPADCLFITKTQTQPSTAWAQQLITVFSTGPVSKEQPEIREMRVMFDSRISFSHAFAILHFISPERVRGSFQIIENLLLQISSNYDNGYLLRINHYSGNLVEVCIFGALHVFLKKRRRYCSHGLCNTPLYTVLTLLNCMVYLKP